ncbi:hypothetical protein [Bacteriovorax sp. DB6_IX]|uniref:hypothetical protein n=1 Tax=Bacteriovorax sp. DB6_IX TaxID=1353530 RepID=UPI00054FF58F|nr:hypothetical protein [Bacteriovorax sp. DB6_IX]
MFTVYQFHYTHLRNLIKTLVLLTSISTYAFLGADEVGNGAGLYENIVAKAWVNLPTTIKRHLENNSDDYGKIELYELDRVLPEIMEKTRIVYFPESDYFFTDGEYRIAMTFNRIGANIFINLDKLYSIPSHQALEVITSLLIHELLHQIGVEDHFIADKIGHLVAQSITILPSTYFLNMPDTDDRISVYNLPSGSPIVHLIKRGVAKDLKLPMEELECEDFILYNMHEVNGSIQSSLLMRCSDNKQVVDNFIIF